ncbi:hypothetical protein M404DRAFT_998980 [Pisolithus tinctorius Marx 270]|uniref:Uncharacterized protein n=1 Tax=Pisolithus tinctorius Marx 270 TaxID=870435 RepID=A0A0C3K9U0_PISTI|nr:hypothetical protein M404DRAFT_998980 [Pisolithus tinctorius Marx 270]
MHKHHGCSSAAPQETYLSPGSWRPEKLLQISRDINMAALHVLRNLSAPLVCRPPATPFSISTSVGSHGGLQ